MTSIEDKVRAALTEEARAITPTTLRYPDFPAPRRRLVSAPVLVAALVAAMLMGGSIGLATAGNADTAFAAAHQIPQVTAGTALAASDAHVTVDGIEIPIPPGWTAVEMAPLPGARQVCLAVPGDVDDACAQGATFAVAATVDGVTASIATRPPDVCPGASQIMTYHPTASIDGRPAIQYRSQCDGHGPAAEYWQLADQSLAISTPLTDEPQVYRDIIAGIDLSGWVHQP